MQVAVLCRSVHQFCEWMLEQPDFVRLNHTRGLGWCSGPDREMRAIPRGYDHHVGLEFDGVVLLDGHDERIASEIQSWVGRTQASRGGPR